MLRKTTKKVSFPPKNNDKTHSTKLMTSVLLKNSNTFAIFLILICFKSSPETEYLHLEFHLTKPQFVPNILSILPQ